MSDTHTPATSAPVAEAHGDGHSHDDIARHVKGYMIVGGALLFCTVLTVALSYVDFDKMIGGHNWNFIIAMILATFKAGLVAAIFMHLKQEKLTIWQFLLVAAFFCTGLFLLTLLHWVDPIFGTSRSTHF